MSTPDHGRFDELLSRYLDATLEGSEEHELLMCLADADLAARFHEMTQLDTEVAGLLAGSIPDEVMVELVWSDLGRGKAPSLAVVTASLEAAVPIPIVPRRTPTKRTGLLLALAAGLVGALGVTAHYFLHAPPSAVPAKIASVRGEASFIGRAGRVALSGGQSLEGDGTIKTVGPDSRVTLALADGTEIALLGNTSFSVGTGSEKRRLFLEAGTIRATVAKQPNNTPLVFSTAEATATVRGTELAIVEGVSDTYLIVMRGAVTLRRSSGGAEVLISAGYYGHVEPDGMAHPWPIARLPRDLRQQVLAHE